MNRIVLAGCTATPLAGYLKALGVLRLLGEHDPQTRGCWRGDRFELHTSMTAGALSAFFLDHYRPTPVVAPWNGGSGFFAKDSKEALQAVLNSSSQRFDAYRAAVQAAEACMAGFGRDESPKDDDKRRLLTLLRGQLPDAALVWFDAAVSLSGGDAAYPPLLGTGGNDGRLDFTNNFMQRLTEVVSTVEAGPPAMSASWLEMSLFGTAAPLLIKKAIGQFSPGQAGGANAGTGFDADATINPWDFVLMIEGALMFAAATVRRSADDPAGVVSFPFTVRAVAAGAGAIGHADGGRGELWMPLWRQASSEREVRTLLGEGRVALGRRPARDALDFVRAVHHFGGYRGVDAFQRYALLMRSGKAFLATPLSRVDVAEHPSTRLIDELDQRGWLDRFRQFARGEVVAIRFRDLRRRLEDRLFDLAGREPNAAETQALLVLLAEVQRALSTSTKAREQVPPVPRLSEHWVLRADDGSPEFRIARALAGLQGVGDVALPLRAQIFPVQRRADRWLAPDDGEKLRIHQPATGRLSADLAQWLAHRLQLMTRMAMPDKPLASPAGALLDDVAAFVQNDAMDARIAALLPGLALCDIPRDADRSAGSGVLPAAFGLMKLALTPDRELRSLGRLGADEHMPVPAGMVAALAAGNADNRAVTLAWRRLRSSGLTPALRPPLPLLAEIEPARAAAALLIPLRWSATAALTRQLLGTPEVTAPAPTDPSLTA